MGSCLREEGEEHGTTEISCPRPGLLRTPPPTSSLGFLLPFNVCRTVLGAGSEAQAFLKGSGTNPGHQSQALWVLPDLQQGQAIWCIEGGWKHPTPFGKLPLLCACGSILPTKPRATGPSCLCHVSSHKVVHLPLAHLPSICLWFGLSPMHCFLSGTLRDLSPVPVLNGPWSLGDESRKSDTGLPGPRGGRGGSQIFFQHWELHQRGTATTPARRGTVASGRREGNVGSFREQRQAHLSALTVLRD
uniref:uncharacterized protein LOC110599263 n=1 Tax=Ictidomys tridecemlineatus TaxID=43179 RepID=UPI001A9FAC08|nr:uncharacterized protein LOC110599263 [Ictidomys tridecemlineatus]